MRSNFPPLGKWRNGGDQKAAILARLLPAEKRIGVLSRGIPREFKPKTKRQVRLTWVQCCQRGAGCRPRQGRFSQWQRCCFWYRVGRLAKPLAQTAPSRPW